MLCDQSLCPKILTPVAGGQSLHPSQPPKSGETGVIGSGAAKYHSLQFFESQGARREVVGCGKFWGGAFRKRSELRKYWDLTQRQDAASLEA